MPNTFWGMQHLNENMLCAVKCETTGLDPEKHELIEVAVLPLNGMLDIHSKFSLFNMRMRPRNIDDIDYDNCRLSRKEIAECILLAFDKDKVAELFESWYTQMGMKEKKRIIPLAHNWPKERALLVNWLGYDTYSTIFSEDHRDIMVAAHYINDRQCVKAEPCVFNKQMLSWLAKKLFVDQIQIGSATSDCYTISQVYKRMLQL
jgi:hypothetical protein